MNFETLSWDGDGLRILDQRRLPREERYQTLTSTEAVAEAIETLAVRGAPAIGVTAAYGVVVAAMESPKREHIARAIDRLRRTRPTAVNLFTALDRMIECLDAAFDSPDPTAFILEEARAFHEQDVRLCLAISSYGAELLADGDTVLTHCNAGALATSGCGTALGVIYEACEQGKNIAVITDETRPLLQGAHLSAWELARNDVPVTVICDNMAAVMMKKGLVNHVIVGADRIAANGDTANKIGTYGLSISARAHDVPFYVAAPFTTFDFSLSTGEGIPIEERAADEVGSFNGIQTIPPDASVYNPAFDVTPASNITAIITEHGVARPPFDETFNRWRANSSGGI